jgi:hypothetical protein
MLTAVQQWSRIDLDRLWILKLEGFGWRVIDLRDEPQADDFYPDGYLVDGHPVVSHKNIGSWVRTCGELFRAAGVGGGGSPLLH